jgi:hypothetical protein
MAGLRLMAELGIDGRGFQSGLNQAKSMAMGFAGALKGIIVQAVGIYAVEQAISKTVDTAKDLVNESKRLSVGVEQLQLLRQAAKDSGTDMEKLAGVFEKIDIARQKALAPTAEGLQERRIFGAMGISGQQLHSQTAAQLFMGPMAQLARTQNPEQYAQAFREVLGKGFGEVLPVLKTNFNELGESMKKMGAIMDTETAVKISHFKDELELVSNVIISQLGPALVKLIEVLYEGILKLGGKIAGEAAGIGAGTAQMSGRNRVGLGIDMFFGGLESLFKRATGKMTEQQSQAYLTNLAKARGYDVAGAQSATSKAEEPWKMRLNQFDALLAKWRKEAFDLDHPKAADFTHVTVPPKLDRKILESASDSLTRVGNFLGGSGTLISRIQEQQVDLLRQIARNTSAGRGSATVLPQPGVNTINSLVHGPAFGQTFYPAH